VTLGRPGAAGALAAAGYLAAVALTGMLASRLVRPLFEGFQPAPAYRWVRPPPPFATGNQAPLPGDGSVALRDGAATGSAAGGVVTPDGQVTVSLGPGAFGRHPGDTAATITITPVDPGALAPLPPGLRADGNAYRIDMAYSPSRAGVGALAAPGDVTLAVPVPAKGLARTGPGRPWEALSGLRVAGGTGETAALPGPGVYVAVAAATPSTEIVTPGAGRPVLGTAAVAAATAALAALMVLAPTALLRHRKPGPS